MRSLGARGSIDVRPIRRAFERCATALRALRPRLEVVLTRCPFPPESYDWDDRVAGTISPAEPYFVKPGNSVLWPPTNGFADWLTGLVDEGRHTLVVGGCTLNSCVRVSAIDVLQHVGHRGLAVVVDLSLCGARAENFRPSPLFGGVSPVASAIAQMRAAGVRVVRRAEWV